MCLPFAQITIFQDIFVEWTVFRICDRFLFLADFDPFSQIFPAQFDQRFLMFVKMNKWGV